MIVIISVLHHGFVESGLLFWAVVSPETDARAGTERKEEAELSDVKILKESTVLSECVAIFVVGEHVLLF